MELEDCIETVLLSSAVNELSRRFFNNSELLVAAKFPKYGKWAHIAAACTKANIPVFQKTDVAYAILDLLAEDPTKSLLDSRLADHLLRLLTAIRDRLVDGPVEIST